MWQGCELAFRRTLCFFTALIMKWQSFEFGFSWVQSSKIILSRHQMEPATHAISKLRLVVLRYMEFTWRSLIESLNGYSYSLMI